MAGLTEKRLSLLAEVLRSADQHSNTVFSPLCLEECLRLLEKAAAGETKSQLQAIIDPEDASQYKNIKDVFAMAQALFVKNTFKSQVKEEYLRETGLTCITGSFRSPKKINWWVKKNTFGMIKNALSEIPKMANLMLCATLAVKMSWAEDYFDPEDYGFDFYQNDSQSVYAEGMRILDDFEGIALKEAQDVTVLAMDMKAYGDMQLESVLIMPEDMDAYMRQFSNRLKKDLNGLTPMTDLPERVELLIPRFKISSNVDLKQVLQKIGVKAVFDSDASDLTHLLHKSGALSDIIQRCFYDFSKEGIEAAASTFGIIKIFSLSEERRKIVFNRPCIFLVRDKHSGNIFFIGNLYEPEIRNRAMDECEDDLKYCIEDYEEDEETEISMDENSDESSTENPAFEAFKWSVLILLEKALKHRSCPAMMDYLTKLEPVLLNRYLEECNFYGEADPKACAGWLIDIFPELPMHFFKKYDMIFNSKEDMEAQMAKVDIRAVDDRLLEKIKSFIERVYIGEEDFETDAFSCLPGQCAAPLQEKAELKVNLPDDSFRNKFIMFSGMEPVGSADDFCIDAGEAFNPDELEELVSEQESTFPEALLSLIDAKGLKDPEVYKKANIDRKHFQKMKNPTYHPGKAAVISLGLALELDFDALQEFIGRADHQLSHAFKTDIVVEYCVKHQIFDVYKINEILYDLGLPELSN